ncbi:TMEM165/GDT1 family protein [Dehalobacterium formicoaceticum]|uniref:TMEM165/GDT1 family protein n=1 Tax=Dehalobacterium formicoaceticum TaxID=51515 RepID=UPI000B7FBCCE|nr:TMEM165/GDT1 family protein [Dehalobacterium formicoaceticum]
MITDFDALITSFLVVVLGEMGDKTQLLGMAFATRFKARTVLAAVFGATVFNHLFAVILGGYLTRLIPMSTIQLLAAISFVFFGLWTFRGDTLEGEDKKDYFNPFLTVFIAFFIAEMGDKTQLATIALAAKYQNIFTVLLASTAGMMVSNIIGIVIGVVMGKKIPERSVKLFSGAIFILFGYIGIYTSLSIPLQKWAALAVISLMVFGYMVYLRREVAKKAASES